jgi:hypothetical protein
MTPQTGNDVTSRLVDHGFLLVSIHVLSLLFTVHRLRAFFQWSVLDLRQLRSLGGVLMRK